VKLAVGMPVFERAWCLSYWFDCLEAQELADKKDITLCFVYSRSFDGSYDILRRRGEEYGNLMIYEFDLKAYSHREDVSRFHELTAYRNGLLDMAKETDAEYFLSWDNDILFQPKALQSLFEVAKPNNAVGALMDMAGNDEAMGFPSVMHFPQGPGEIAYRNNWNSYPQDKPFQCDVIMAVKLMGKEVYENTRYRWDVTGEDIGWCHDCDEKGYKRFLQPKARGIHLYDKDLVIAKMRQHYRLNYPAILDPLRTWYK
jgi:hypothetical protein